MFDAHVVCGEDRKNCHEQKSLIQDLSVESVCIANFLKMYILYELGLYSLIIMHLV